MPLDATQTDRLDALVTQLEALCSHTDREGASEVLDALYLVITEIYEKFPELDVEEE